MGKIKGWSLKQRTRTETIWENHGIAKGRDRQGRSIHKGQGTILTVLKVGHTWYLTAEGEIRRAIAFSKSRRGVELKAVSLMKRFPNGFEVR